jgi:CheY-like chemotaxis protein
LVVDDEPKVAFFLQASLESLERNYQVVCAGTGESALAEMTRTPFDVMITDLRMPGMNGLELMQHVQSSFPQTRTILITAYGSDEVEAETRRLSAYRYFTKPFHIEDLTAAVQDALGNGAAPAAALLERLTQRLTDLRYEVGAQCILLADRNGRLLAEVGAADGVAAGPLAALMSQRLAAEREARRLLNEDRSYELHYHEGVRYDVYSANLGDRFSLTLAFDRRMGASRIGMVWLYTKRAIQDLAALVAGKESAVEASR